MQWPQIGLLIFPMITGTTGIFFAVLGQLKYKIQIPSQPPFPHLNMNPFGDELVISRIFIVSGFVQLIVTGILGYDSILHPQLINDYMILYLFLLAALYGFTWFLIPFFIYGKAHIGIIEYSQDNNSSISINSQQRLIQYQSFSDLKFWLYTSMVLFALLEIGLITESGIYYFGNDQIKSALTSGFGSIFLKLPGSQTIYGENLRISLIIWIILISSPLLFFIGIIHLYYRMWHLNRVKKDHLQNYLANLPEDQQLLLKKSLIYMRLLAKREQ